MKKQHAFIFTYNGRPFGSAARTLKEFVTMLTQVPVASVEDHARRSDFSRWISEVFGDQPLAAEIRKVERKYRRGELTELRESLIEPIRERYELIGVPLLLGKPGA